MKLEIVKPLLQERADHRFVDVQEGLVLDLAVLDEFHHAGSFSNEQPVVVARSQRNADRVHEAASDLHEGQLDGLRQFATGEGGVVFGFGGHGGQRQRGSEQEWSEEFHR
jgi:hypothetical protein